MAAADKTWRLKSLHLLDHVLISFCSLVLSQLEETFQPSFKVAMPQFRIARVCFPSLQQLLGLW